MKTGITGKMIRAGAILALALVLIYFNLPSKDPKDRLRETEYKETSEADSTEHGSANGKLLPDFEIQMLDGSSFRLEDCRGRATVINLWATWCTPCINELPFFNELQLKYPDDCIVLAIHSDLITDDVDEYLKQFNYEIGFAIDETAEVKELVGGTTMLPQTIVLDRKGIVAYNQIGSITFEKLEEIVKEAARDL